MSLHQVPVPGHGGYSPGVTADGFMARSHGGRLCLQCLSALVLCFWDTKTAFAPKALPVKYIGCS